MSNLQELIAQIPIRHDLISYINFTGVLLGLLLALIIWMRAPAGNRALHYYALFLACISLVIFDTFLCYTGWMKYTLQWNDSTEPLTLLIAPLLYLSIRFLILRKPISRGMLIIHFAPAVLYAISQTGYYLQPLAVKYNAYVGAYFSELPFSAVPPGTTYVYHTIKDLHRWLLLLSFAVYGVFSLRVWYFHRNQFGNAARKVRISKYRFARYILLAFLTALIVFISVYSNFEDDRGDHFLTLLTTLIIMLTAIALISESRFFEKAWLIDKYETSSRQHEALKLEEIQRVVSQSEFFSSQDPSLKKLAATLGTHPNVVSRVINQQTGGNFNDFVNGYRVELAKERLRSREYRNLTIEAIGQSVGFRSKSSFYQAFKKHAGVAPSQFLKRNMEE